MTVLSPVHQEDVPDSPATPRGGHGQPVTAPVSALRYDMENAPLGGKLQLLNPSGVLVFGTLTVATRSLYWAWAPLPQRNKDEERRRKLV